MTAKVKTCFHINGCDFSDLVIPQIKQDVGCGYERGYCMSMKRLERVSSRDGEKVASLEMPTDSLSLLPARSCEPTGGQIS